MSFSGLCPLNLARYIFVFLMLKAFLKSQYNYIIHMNAFNNTIFIFDRRRFTLPDVVSIHFKSIDFLVFNQCLTK